MLAVLGRHSPDCYLESKNKSRMDVSPNRPDDEWQSSQTTAAGLHLSGGVRVMVCAVNSSSKYLVSVSDVTCGLKRGESWRAEEDQDGSRLWEHHVCVFTMIKKATSNIQNWFNTNGTHVLSLPENFSHVLSSCVQTLTFFCTTSCQLIVMKNL